VEVVASLSQGRTAAAQCGLFTHKSVPVIFEPPCTLKFVFGHCTLNLYTSFTLKNILLPSLLKKINTPIFLTDIKELF